MDSRVCGNDADYPPAIPGEECETRNPGASSNSTGEYLWIPAPGRTWDRLRGNDTWSFHSSLLIFYFSLLTSSPWPFGLAVHPCKVEAEVGIVPT